MNRRRIEEMVRIAMDILMEDDTAILKDGKIPSTYSGYIDSYGPTIRLSGLLQALSYYEKDRKEGDNEGIKRYHINDLLKLLLTKANFIENQPDRRLIDLVKETSADYNKKKKSQRLIFEAITACKLAMRTFPKVHMEETNR